ncbi:MAG: hypothetical protein IK088_07505 [Lachnospiraceae bacterium]|nr:hypothetical protein [Lachnospiraceae bacterium]
MKLLIADPDRGFLASYQKLLTAAGHEVLTAFDGVQALSALNEEEPEAVAFRADLPRINTVQFLAAAQKKQIPVILTSTEDLSGKYAVKPAAMLCFPFSFDTFLKAVGQAGKESHT